MRIAIIGAGAAGLVAARHLLPRHQITVYEASDHVGGHCVTRRVDDERGPFTAEMGFFSFVPSAYPEFVQLLAQLGVPTMRLHASFCHASPLEGISCRGSLNSPFFFHRVSLANRRWLGFPLEVVRFWRQARKFLAAPSADHVVGDFLAEGNYSHGFVSALTFHAAAFTFGVDRQQLLMLPTRFFLGFVNRYQLLRFSRHGLRGIVGGSQGYIERLTEGFRSHIRLRTPIAKLVRSHAGVELTTASGHTERFDAAVVAVPGDRALELLADPSELESRVLSAFRYQPMEIVLHTDAKALGCLRPPWASLNSLTRSCSPGTKEEVLEFHACVNRFFSLDTAQDYFVSRLPSLAPEPGKVIDRRTFFHLVVDRQACWAQQQRQRISGTNRTFYCGSHWGDALHESAVATGLEVARQIDPALMVA